MIKRKVMTVAAAILLIQPALCAFPKASAGVAAQQGVPSAAVFSSADSGNIAQQTAAANTGDVVPDMVTREYVNLALGNEDVSAPVSTADMEDLIHFYYYGDYSALSAAPRLKSLEGLQYATHLQYLDIQNADLGAPNSLSPLKGLKELISVSIGGSLITNEALADLGAVENLQHVFLRTNRFDNCDGLKPLFARALAEFRADPNNVEYYFHFDSYKNPITDFSGFKDYYHLATEREEFYGTGAEQAASWATSLILRGLYPSAYDVTYPLYPDYEQEWGAYTKPLQLETIWSPRVSDGTKAANGRVTLKEGVTDFFGDKTLFSAPCNWKDDLEYNALGLPYSLNMHAFFEYIAFLANGFGEYEQMDTIESYFTLKSRDSLDYPGETEYYYEGRDFNIVPFNPDATGPQDRQDAVTVADGAEITIYYYELKNFNNPIPAPDGTGYIPSIYENVDGVTQVVFTGNPYVRQSNAYSYGMGGPIIYRKAINWISPLPPVIDGLTDETIFVGESFDPMAGVTAYDPTVDEHNPDGATPRDLTNLVEIYSGALNVNDPGTYTLGYRVVSPYGLETTGGRTILVEALPKPAVPFSPSGSGRTGAAMEIGEPLMEIEPSPVPLGPNPATGNSGDGVFLFSLLTIGVGLMLSSRKKR